MSVVAKRAVRSRREHAVDLLRRMLEIPSPSYGERPLAEHLGEELTDLGFDVRIDDVGNVVAEAGSGGAPTVMLAGHLDTAPGHVAVREERSRLFGRGAADAKGPLAAMIVAAAARGERYPGRLVLVGAVEEETPASRGAVHIATTTSAPDVLIVGEPSGWPAVTIGYKGKLDIAFRARRPAVHSTKPVEKASDAALAFWQNALRAAGCDLQDPARGHAAFDRVGVTAEKIRGDLEAAVLELSFRLPVALRADDLVRLLREAAGGDEVDVVAKFDAVARERGDAAVRALSAAIRRAGATPRLKLKTATSDMNVFAQHWDIPMASYGPGDSHLDHTTSEHVEIADYLASISVLGDALDDLAAAAASSSSTRDPSRRPRRPPNDDPSSDKEVRHD